MGLFFGAILSVLSFFCLSFTNALVKLLQGHIPVFQLLFLQNVVGVVITGSICLIRGKKLSFLQSHHYGLLLLRAFVGLLAFFFLFISISHVTVTNATLLLNTAPLFVPFLLLLIFREKMNQKLWLGIIPGFIGIALILDPKTTIFQWQALYPLIAGLCVAALYLVIRQLHAHKEPMLRVFVFLFVCSALLTCPFGLIQWQQPTSHEWWLLLLISTSTFLSQSLITYSLRFGPARALAPLCYTAVIFASLFDWFIWHVAPSWVSVFGILLVIAGGITTLLLETRKSKTH